MRMCLDLLSVNEAASAPPPFLQILGKWRQMRRWPASGGGNVHVFAAKIRLAGGPGVDRMAQRRQWLRLRPWLPGGLQGNQPLPHPAATRLDFIIFPWPSPCLAKFFPSPWNKPL
jgi:hypothetical protein